MPPAARVTDVHTCPKNPAGPVLPPGEPTVLICFMPAARLGDPVACSSPEFIASGEDTVLIGGKPAARMGDLTGGPNVCPAAGPGVISTGCPTVLIGKNYHANVLARASNTGAPFCEASDAGYSQSPETSNVLEDTSLIDENANNISENTQVLTTNDIEKLKESLEEGDMVLTSGDYDVSKLIRTVTHGDYSHAAIVAKDPSTGDLVIVDAPGEHQVPAIRKVSVDSFFNNTQTAGVFRPVDSKMAEDAADWAFKQVGDPDYKYDIFDPFSESPKTVYCSDFIYQAYKNQGLLLVDQPINLLSEENIDNTVQAVRDYHLNYFENLVADDEKIINDMNSKSSSGEFISPTQLSESNSIKPIVKFESD